MERGLRGAAAAVVVVVVAGCCLQGAQGTSVPATPGVHYPYFCPKEVTVSKLKINQSESGYVQYTEYDTKIPSLTSFTMHYWFNLEDVTKAATMFNYGTDPASAGDLLTVRLEPVYRALYQYYQHWTIYVNGVRSKVKVSPLIKSGQWYHALHTWDSTTGVMNHFINGNHLQSQNLYEIKGIVIPGRGVAVSGQHQNTELTQGMDQGEGINGWFTLFQMSAKPLGSFAEAETKAKLASQCSADMEGDLISWTTTPRKGYGGITETPSYSKACGRF